MRIRSIALTLLLGAIATPANAADPELESRVKALEAQLKALQDELKAKAPADAPKAEPNKTEPQKPANASATTFSYSGFVKLDMLSTVFSDNEVAGNTSGRDFYVPSQIPVNEPEHSSRHFDAHAKQTRFAFNTVTPLENGEKISTHIELDFLNHFDGDERVGNGYSPAIRHAYFSYGNWLAGQTWNNLMDLSAMPETVGFIGPSDSAVFGRQPQIRYTNGAWAVALENPETTYTPFGGGVRQSADDDTRPDLTARYQYKFDAGHLSAAAVYRQLRYDNETAGSTTTGLGINLSGKLLFGNEDVRFMLVDGSGLGRYVGLNATNDAVLDDVGDLEAIDLRSAFIAWRHSWTSTLRSTFMHSQLEIDNPVDLTGTAVSRRIDSQHANLIWSPAKQLDVGLEYIRATRELESGLDGDMERWQFMAKYSFR